MQACSCGRRIPIPPDGLRFQCAACARIHDPRDRGFFTGQDKVAEREDWLVEGMDLPVEEHAVDWSFEPGDLERIGWGFIPRSMEDKWFIYRYGDDIYFHRSWTGAFCSRARLEGNRIRSVAIPTGSSDREGMVRRTRWLIDFILIGREVPYPG